MPRMKKPDCRFGSASSASAMPPRAAATRSAWATASLMAQSANSESACVTLVTGHMPAMSAIPDNNATR